MTPIEQAIAAHQAGNLAEAEALYRQILQRDAGDFDALHMLGIIHAQREQYEEAEQLLRTAVAVDGHVPPCLQNYGNVLSKLKRYEEAIGVYDKAIAIAPTYAPLHSDRGHAQHQLGRYDEALASYDRAIALKPDLADAYYNRGLALTKLKRNEEALTSHDRALTIDHQYVAAQSARGDALLGLGRMTEAVTNYEKALTINPDYTGSLYNLAHVLMDLNRLGEAAELVRRAAAIEPDRTQTVKAKGRLALLRGELETALAHFQRAISRDPKQADAYNNMSIVLTELGRLDEALAAYEKAIALEPENTVLYVRHAEGKKFSASDPEIDAMQALGAKTLTALDRMYLDLALAKAYADIKDYPRSFRHLLAANATKRATIDYSERRELAPFDRIERIFTPELMAAKAGAGDPSRLPIFVLGMPRSGTSLVEQILASHPAVHGAGEVMTLHDVIENVRSSAGFQVPYPDGVPALDPAALKAAGADYVKRISMLAPQAERISNKMPSNFFYVGFIQMALPNAVIIHTVRDPVDTCISCFSIHFRIEHFHTYDLGELGRYYRRYQRLMQHWRRVLPPGRMLEVRYEDVIADFEGQARRIIDHCGLPWDERCLTFYRTERHVRTASAVQVRQPIYSSAVGRGRVYAEFLGPLLRELDGIGAENGSAPEIIFPR